MTNRRLPKLKPSSVTAANRWRPFLADGVEYTSENTSRSDRLTQNLSLDKDTALGSGEKDTELFRFEKTSPRPLLYRSFCVSCASILDLSFVFVLLYPHFWDPWSTKCLVLAGHQGTLLHDSPISNADTPTDRGRTIVFHVHHSQCAHVRF